MALEMLDDRVAILPLEDPSKIGHIYVPDSAKQRVDQGIVKYRGPNVRDVKVGDHVFFSGYDGTKVSIEGEGTFIVMREEAIKVILLDEERNPTFTLREFNQIVDELDLTEEGEDVADDIRDCLSATFYDKGLEF